MGVAAVGVLFASVRRTVPDPRQGTIAGLVAGAVLACTPAAALMFRFNNPDAFLVLLLVIAAYCLTRAVAAASWRWLALVGAVMGAAFLTKMLQGFLVLPGFAAAYLLAAPMSWRNRVLHLITATGALVVAAGWWVVIVQLIPAASRPYIGGSTDDTVLDLAFGYNGLSRILGRGSGADSQWGGATFKPMNSSSGLHRLFAGEFGNEVSWLLPVALFVLAFGGYLLARGILSRDERAAVLSWGGWLLVTGLVFSFMNGTVHPYYTVALVPAVAALVGLGSVWAYRLRSGWGGRIALAAMFGLAGWWSVILLHRNHFGPRSGPWLIATLGAVGIAAALIGRRWSAPGVAAGALGAIAGTVAFSVATAMTPHHGAIPNAVDSVHHMRRAEAQNPANTFAVGGWTGDAATNGQLAELLAAAHTPWSAATNGSQSAAVLEIASGTAVMAIGGWSGDPAPTLDEFVADVRAGKISYYVEAGKGGAAEPHGPVIRAENHSASHARDIADWVAAHYRPTTIGESSVYRLI
jgi:4-amino-4-deoxy-L-arabinose transferase-like glycosyltransferase